MTRTSTLLSALGCVLVMSACARPVAKTAPDGPPLDMPAPPPRDVVPADPEEVPDPMPLPKEPAHQAPTTRQRQTQRPEPSRADAKPEARPDPPLIVEPAKPAEELPKPPATSSTTLQTTPAGEESAVEASIRGSIDRAKGYLTRIDYRVLNKDARNQYDTAKRYVELAEEAIHARNLEFARTIADKAANLAAKLAGR
jgi:hypothetical protein